MKSNKNTRAVAVGIFIFAALVIFILGVLTLGGQKKMFADTLQIKALFNDVNGLQTGNNVWYAGVKVGTIEKIQFTGSGQVEVTMSVDEKVRPYLKKDTKVKVGSDGLIGNKILVLYGGTAAAAQVTDGEQLAADNMLSIDDMMQTFQQNNQNLVAITNDLKVVSSGLANGKGSIGKLLKDETLANQLDLALISLRRSLSQTENFTQDIAAYTNKLQQKGSLTNDLITDTVIFGRLRASVAQMQTVSQTAQEVVDNLKNATSNVNASLTNTSTPAGMLLNDAQTAQSLKAVIKNLETSTQKLDENMEALQHNFLFRGYFRKKNKNL
jgi:phospholipid/cholesterol/gamma-HCH transport system substrate-binding protein